MRTMSNIGLYIHIPFCAKKCNYCDFLSARYDEQTIDKYFAALYKQIDIESDRIRDGVASIYIGGGTPSFVDDKYIARLMEKLFLQFSIAKNAEITIEVNPASAIEGKLGRYIASGINRLSFGLQSTDEGHLKSLGRIHNMQDFLSAYEGARAAGFDNINIDLIYALPGQSLGEYEQDLQRIVELSPEHISAYSLIIEENTVFYDMYYRDLLRKEGGERTLQLCDEDVELQMLRLTGELLTANNYKHYEISNYAKEGFYSEHNCRYWNRGDYLGLGLGAASLIDGRRFSAIKDIYEYINILNNKDRKILSDIYEDVTILSPEDEIGEALMLGLRLTKGVNVDKINQLYDTDISDIYREQIYRWTSKGLLRLDDGRLFLTQKGLELANIVMKDFI